MKFRAIKRIVEGGGATGLSPVLQKDVLPTIKKVAEHLGIPFSDVHIVGSTGKAAYSGDIDIAVDATRYSPTELHNKMQQVGHGGKMNKGFNIGSYMFPIKGNPKLGYVQVDIMYVESPQWAKFFIYGPAPTESVYKGVVRNVLLGAVASTLNQPGVDWILRNKEGEMIASARRVFNMDKGLVTKFSYRKKLPSGKYKKEPTIVTAEEFQKLFPTAKFKHFAEMNPVAIVELLFGRDVKPEDVTTAEKVLKLIKTRFDPATQQKIFDKAAITIKPYVKQGVGVPKEIAPVFETQYVLHQMINEMSDMQLNYVEHAIEMLFRDLNLNIIWTTHFRQRVAGREQRVGMEELYNVFKKLKEKYNDRLFVAKDSQEEFVGVLKDMSRYLNLPFTIDFDKENKMNNKYHLRAITIVRKDPNEFKTNVRGGIELKV